MYKILIVIVTIFYSVISYCADTQMMNNGSVNIHFGVDGYMLEVNNSTFENDINAVLKQNLRIDKKPEGRPYLFGSQLTAYPNFELVGETRKNEIDGWTCRVDFYYGCLSICRNGEYTYYIDQQNVGKNLMYAIMKMDEKHSLLEDRPVVDETFIKMLAFENLGRYWEMTRDDFSRLWAYNHNRAMAYLWFLREIENDSKYDYLYDNGVLHKRKPEELEKLWNEWNAEYQKKNPPPDVKIIPLETANAPKTAPDTPYAPSEKGTQGDVQKNLTLTNPPTANPKSLPNSVNASPDTSCKTCPSRTWLYYLLGALAISLCIALLLRKKS